ncbi:hypothetical protein VaNZ11_005603, partial [Volvox africanus]
ILPACIRFKLLIVSYALGRAKCSMLLVSALALLLIWVVKVVFGYKRQEMDVRGFPSSNVWGLRAACVEKNWWEASNDRKPADHELVEIVDTDGGSNAPVIPGPQCVCLQCGALIPVTKNCGNCKLATYCSRECQKQHWQCHKPKCARLQQAERERTARGLPRPPAPPPDLPLQLPTRQLVFSRKGYRELLGVHRTGRQVAAASAPSAAVNKIQQGDYPLSHSHLQRQLQPDEGPLSESNEILLDCGTESTQQLNLQGQQSASAGSSPPSEFVSLSSCSSSPALPASSAATSTSPLSSCSPLQTSHASASQRQHHADQEKSILETEGSTGARQPHRGERGLALEVRAGADGRWPWGWSGAPSLALLTPARPAGIYNTGNSCYAASAIQALLATPGLGEYLRSGVHCGTCVAPEPGQIQGVSSWCPACELSRLAADAAASVATDSSLSSSPSSSTIAAGQGHRCPANGLASPTPSSSSAWGAAAARVWPWSRPQATVDAGGLTRQVFRVGRTLMPGRQEDAHELLTKLLEALAEVQLAEAGGRGLLRGIANRKASVLRHQSTSAAATIPSADGVGKSSASPLSAPPLPQMWRGEETSLVHQVFGGYLRRATLCDCCGYVSQSHESVLGLEVHLGSRVSSVEAGLRGYFADEVLDEGNEYRCDRCRQLVCATRRVRLEVAPNALVITLKRFATTGVPAGAWGPKMSKDTRPIALRMDLDLTPFMAPGALDQGPAAYCLYGVVQHLGVSSPGSGSGFLSAACSEYDNTGPSHMSLSMHVGHYVAVVRGGNGCWYRCDDDEVTQVSEREVAAITDAYLLFYERIQPHVPPEVVQEIGPEKELEVNGRLRPSMPDIAGRLDQEHQQAGQAEMDKEEQQDKERGEDGVAAAVAEAPAGGMAQTLCSSTTFYSPVHSNQAIQHPDANGRTCTMEAAAAAAMETILVTGVPALPDLSSPTWSAWLGPDTVLSSPASGAASTAGQSELAVVFKVVAGAAPVVCPDFRLLPPRAPHVGEPPGGTLGGREDVHQVWMLRIRMPGVKSAREVRMAATHPPPSPPQLTATTNDAKESNDAAIAATGSTGGWHNAGRVRVWVVGCYSLDVQLGLRNSGRLVAGTIAADESINGARPWQLEVIGEDGFSGQVHPAALPGFGLEVEVLQPRWRPASSSLFVPLRLRALPRLESC